MNTIAIVLCACVQMSDDIFFSSWLYPFQLFCPFLCTCLKSGCFYLLPIKKICRWAIWFAHVCLFLNKWIWFTISPLTNSKNNLIFALSWVKSACGKNVFIFQRASQPPRPSNCIQYWCKSFIFHFKVTCKGRK